MQTITVSRRSSRDFVAESRAVAALEEDQPLADLGQVGQNGLAVLVQDFGAGWGLNDEGGGISPGAVAAPAVLAALRLEMLAIAEIDQRVQPFGHFEHDIGAPAAIAAVGTALIDELLAPERSATRAAIAAAQVYLCLVQEFHCRS